MSMPFKLFVSVAALALVVSCSPDEEARVVDLMDGYYAFVEVAEEASPEVRWAALRTHVLARDTAFTAAFLGFTEQWTADDAPRLDRFLARMIELEPEIRDYHRLFHGTLPDVADRVAATLDENLYDVPVYVTVGLFSSNGQVRFIDESPAIMIGLDALAHDDATLFTARTPPDLRPLLAHEYFHAWHMAINPFIADVARRSLPPEPDAPAWASLWLEGLAACYSRIAFPDASIHRVLSVEGIWDDAEPRLAELAAMLLPLLDSREPQVFSDWFYLSSTRDDLPRKAAYILGTVAAHHVVDRIGLDAAARLEGAQLRATVADALRSIADADAHVPGPAVCVPAPTRDGEGA